MTFASESPVDGEPLDPVEATDLEDVEARVAEARKAGAAWAARPLVERIDVMVELKGRILSRAEEIAELVHREVGKPVEEAALAEVLPNADLVDYWCDSIEELLDRRVVELDPISYPGKQGFVQHEARGVVALITPWNYPVAIPLRTLVPALLAGNAVVFKPSEITPRCGALVASLFDGLLPEGLLQLVQGDGEAGKAVVGSDVDLVVFTGSVPTGRAIAVACAERLIPCSLELGGKDPAYVRADADLAHAVTNLVDGAFFNSGQSCCGIERIYVHESVHDDFVEAAVAEARYLADLTADLFSGEGGASRKRPVDAEPETAGPPPGGKRRCSAATDGGGGEAGGAFERCGSRSARDGGCVDCVLPFGHDGPHDLGVDSRTRHGRAAAPPATPCRTGVSTSRKLRSSRNRRMRETIFERVIRRSRDSLFTTRSR